MTNRRVFVSCFLFIFLVSSPMWVLAGNEEALLGRKNFELVKREIPLTNLVTMPVGVGNAADIYWLAFRDYHSPTVNDVLVRGERETKDPEGIYWNSPEIAFIEQATEISICHFAPAYWPYATNFNDPTPGWDCLYKLAESLRKKGEILLGEAYSESNPSLRLQKKRDALRLFEKVIIFGYHVENERLSLTQTIMGANIISMGLAALENYFSNEKDEKNSSLTREMIRDNNSFSERLERKSSLLITSFNPRSSPPPAIHWDTVFEIAQHDRDTMFRLEAICLMNAALREFSPMMNIDPQLPSHFNATTTKKTLRRIMGRLTRLDLYDSDPLIQEAARRALSPGVMGELKKIVKEELVEARGGRKGLNPWIPPVVNF